MSRRNEIGYEVDELNIKIMKQTGCLENPNSE